METRPFLVGISVQENQHLVQSEVDKALEIYDSFLATFPSQVAEIGRDEFALSQTASYVKQRISEGVRKLPQNCQAMSLEEPGRSYNDFDARLFAGKEYYFFLIKKHIHLICWYFM